MRISLRGLAKRLRKLRARLRNRIALRLGVATVAVASVFSPAPATADDAVSFFRAAQVNDAGRIKPLLARGLDPNERDPERGETGMIVALRNDAMDVFALLLAQPKIDLEAQAGNGNTALMMAAFKNNMPAVKALLAKGAQVNRPGWTALHYAAAAGALDIMRLLLERHAYIDADSPTKVTPLMLAAREGQEDAVKLLLKEGADASLRDAGFRSDAAEFAERADKPWIAKAIRQHQAEQVMSR
ncbi:ankyrin repeat domain-containing protein [Pseudoduganella sp. SL102]|uniref:ankyrin repeat domain-containing protein n=1 Tax=Pseudoduganella sp. SL102 TaxID=2995154 RepID=UPI00248C5752|nr:ankyrin repeat domain-containing protein [Pseudoduganella sp. SL102]WBS00053.1 ankyrin repeat domain-containing protein [Pseudoduganella sp. SL102]